MCRDNRRIFTKWQEFKWRRGGIQIAVLSARAEASTALLWRTFSFLFHKLFNSPDFSGSGSNRIYQGQRSRKGMTASRGLEITTLLKPVQSRHADSRRLPLRSISSVPKVAFSIIIMELQFYIWFLPLSCSNCCSPAKSIELCGYGHRHHPADLNMK